MSTAPIDLTTLSDDARDALDELVHDVASREASDANNGDQTGYLTTHGITADPEADLDELTHDAASQQASDVINSGDHIAYLTARGYTTADIRTAIA